MRWSQSIRLPGGARVNVSRNSVGVSTGLGPIRVGANTKGRRFASAKIPGVPALARHRERRRPHSQAYPTFLNSSYRSASASRSGYHSSRRGTMSDPP